MAGERLQEIDSLKATVASQQRTAYEVGQERFRVLDLLHARRESGLKNAKRIESLEDAAKRVMGELEEMTRRFNTNAEQD